MLKHLNDSPKPPGRVTVMGARGFVGAAIVQHLTNKGMPVQALSRIDIDLLQADAGEKLAARLKPDDAFVFVSAIAPCRDADGLLRNLGMVKQACAALTQSPVAHVVNIGSDALYPATTEMVSERTLPSPGDFHGMMHSAREMMLQASVKLPLVLLRPSLLYGAADPHNGYGPNRFRRLAAEGKEISLFGEGEEKRDHVFIDDVAALVGLCIEHRSTGILNVATGHSVSFRRIAELVGGEGIVGTPRRNAVVHRHFDVTDRIKAFPHFAFTPLEQGLARVQQQISGGRNG